LKEIQKEKEDSLLEVKEKQKEKDQNHYLHQKTKMERKKIRMLK